MKKLKRPPSQELLNQAADLLNDGASQREVCRTTGLARETIRKHFPGKGWTYVEGGQFRQLTKGVALPGGGSAEVVGSEMGSGLAYGDRNSFSSHQQTGNTHAHQTHRRDS